MAIFGYDVGRLTEGAFKVLFTYFLLVGGLIGFSFLHGLLTWIIPDNCSTTGAINGVGGVTICTSDVGFSQIIYEANKLFLTVMLIPLAVLIIGILILNIYFPFMATLLTDFLTGIFKFLNWDFTPLVARDSFGNPTFAVLDATALTEFYFNLVNALADILLDLSVFDLKALGFG